jgi:hypothetical protein
MKAEYETIKKHLPQNAKTILDIGSGVAGIDVLISKHYKNKISIFLIDKTQVDDKIYYKFNKKGAFYNSLNVSKMILNINGVPLNKIYLQEATKKNEINFRKKFDIVISLISWGFHYPVSTYLDKVYTNLNKNGTLILDIRKNTHGMEEIKRKFGNYKIINETKTITRILATK